MSQGMTWNFSMACTRYMRSRSRDTHRPVLATNMNHSPRGSCLGKGREKSKQKEEELRGMGRR